MRPYFARLNLKILSVWSDREILFIHGTVNIENYANSFTVYTSLNVECVTVVVMASAQFY